MCICLWLAALPCFAESAIEFYIFRQCTYIVFILPCTKPKQLANCLKRAETSVVLMFFWW